MNPYFKFKQFTIQQDLCAMKVGTDGVLIGSWAAIGDGNNRSRLLDIGCGSALIAIMAAQRSSSLQIDAIDLEGQAIRQAQINVSNSPWSDRINVIQSSVQEYRPPHQYDYIVSNPPYFINSLKDTTDGNDARMVARHSDDTLPYSDLAASVERLLLPNGIFSLILPYVEANLFIVEAAKHSLYCIKRVDIKGTPNKPIKRVMLQFSRNKQEISNDELIIEDSFRHDYTAKYRELTKDFYLKF